MKALFNSLWSKVNKPLPGWLTILLLCTAVAAADTFANVTVDNSGVGNTTLTVQNTNSSENSLINCVSANTAHYGCSLVFKDVATSGHLQGFGSITAQDTTSGVTTGSMNFGEVYDGTTNRCGYTTLGDTMWGTSGTAIEAINTVCGHIVVPHDVQQFGQVTPSSCLALVECGTYQWDFSQPYISISGTQMVPTCFGVTSQDVTTPTAMWLVSVNSVSSTGGTNGYGYVVLNYAPTIATTVAHQLYLSVACFESNF